MSYVQHNWSGALQDAFKACAEVYKKVGTHHWKLHLGEGMPPFVTACMAGDWLLLEAPFAEGDRLAHHSLWRLLEWNAELPGGAKFALACSEPALQLRVEIPLIKGVDLAARVHQACQGFRRGWANIHDLSDDVAGNGPIDGAEPTGDLPHLCQETGWPFSEPATGRLRVELETPNGLHQATIEQRFSQVHVEVEIAASESISRLCRESLEVFLLATASQLRMARPAVAETEGGFGARMEVAFDQLPSVQELRHALSALSMGCRIAASEAATLQQDEALAREYLSLWRVDRRAAQALRPIGKSNQLTKAPTGAEKGATIWVQQ